MRKSTILLFLLAIFLFKQDVFSQVIQYGVGGGLTFVLSPSNFTSDIDTTGRNYNFTSNYHLGGKFKMGIWNSPIKLAAYLYYSSFHGSKNNVILRNAAVNYSTSTSLWTFGVGGEYHFNPKPISPYTSLDIQFNNLNDQNFETDYVNSTSTTSTNGWTRLGLALGAGVDFTLLEQLDLDTAVKFNFVNMFGKQAGEGGLNTFTITINLLYSPNITENK